MNVEAERIKEISTHIYVLLVRVADEDSEPRTIVTNANKSGVEAWRALNDRYYHKSKRTATEVSDRIRALARAKTAPETFKTIQQLEALVSEWEKHKKARYGEDEKRQHFCA